MYSPVFLPEPHRTHDIGLEEAVIVCCLYIAMNEWFWSFHTETVEILEDLRGIRRGEEASIENRHLKLQCWVRI